MDLGNLVRIAIVAEMFGVSEHTVRGWIRDKKLRKTKLGGLVFIAKADLEDFIRRSNAGDPSHSAADAAKVA